MKEIDRIGDWIDSIRDSNRVTMTMYDNIKEVQGRSKAQILEVDKYCSVASMETFIDDSKKELTSIEVMV